MFGREGAKNLASDKAVPFLGEVPIVQTIREAGDVGRPAALQDNTVASTAFETLTRNTIEQLMRRNDHLPPTQAVKITTMAGCSAVKS